MTDARMTLKEAQALFRQRGISLAALPGMYVVGWIRSSAATEYQTDDFDDAVAHAFAMGHAPAEDAPLGPMGKGPSQRGKMIAHNRKLAARRMKRDAAKKSAVQTEGEFNTKPKGELMPASLNKVTLIGNVGQDPEYRSFQNGGRVASFSLATSKRYKDKAGAVKEQTEWHKIQIFNEATIKLCEKYVRKGTHLYLEGALETREFTDKDGNKRSVTEITLRPYNGDLRILSFKDGKPADEELGDMPADLGEPLPY